MFLSPVLISIMQKRFTQNATVARTLLAIVTILAVSRGALAQEKPNSLAGPRAGLLGRPVVLAPVTLRHRCGLSVISTASFSRMSSHRIRNTMFALSEAGSGHGDW